MSDTPKTDQFIADHHYAYPRWDWQDHASVYADFARQLERELNEANRLLDIARRHPYLPNSLAQILNK